ncbi:MAG TPA: NAD(P)/FAD-dependent oxidoreductase [Bryobacteraceae bacterium]|nr:NAD(P)/FAD-dependent oxidoreductase [Bryobacteraceae bacterium]
MPSSPVVIIGAGLSGLACALRLQQKGVYCQIFEASNCVGGRVRTNVADGFLFDRGFQVLLSAYPQTQRTLDYSTLRLKSFLPGALVRFRGRFHQLADPLRSPAEALPALLSSVASAADKLRIISLRQRVCSPSIPELLKHPEVTTLARLREIGFSERTINHFFRPFLGGIFLERDLVTSSRKFEFIFRMFALGEATLPAEGMQAIPQQLANRLRPSVLRLGVRVASITEGGVQLESGETVKTRRVVVATAQAEAYRLIGKGPAQPGTSTTCIYYSAERTPVHGPWLVLNGEGAGPINNLCVLTEVQRTYAPAGTSLISVTVVDPTFQSRADLELAVRGQLENWYGPEVARWRHLRTDHIANALPLQAPPSLDPVAKPVKISERLFVCGDHTTIASIEGAITSGQRAADAAISA